MGFTEYEGRSLVAPMEHSPATMYEIAKRARMPHSNAYGVLASLSCKAAVQQMAENPARFAPLDP